MTSRDLLVRSLAQAVLNHVHGPSHTLGCAVTLWAENPDGSLKMVQGDESACNCRLRQENLDRAEVRALAVRILNEGFGDGVGVGAGAGVGVGDGERDCSAMR